MSQLDTRGFFPDTTPNPALGQIANTITENKRYKEEKEYRREKASEADEWRKLDLIQGLTDISKHQTSNDVANAVGNQKAAEVLQKYTAEAKTMSPAELQGKISQEMSGLIGGMDAMKSELDLSDATLKQLKVQHPDLNIAELAKAHREDILKRRMDASLNFVNPLAVPPSQVDLSNPEYLADFITDDAGMIKAITNPQGGDPESVLMGKQGDYTKFEGKVNYWKKPNYDRTKFNSEGFYTGKDIPSLVTKGSALPTDVMPSSNGKPFMVIDKDVLDEFTLDKNQRLGLLAATKRRFPDYGKFNQQEKEYAQRNVLFDMVETLDQSQLHPTGNVRPPVTHVRVNSGGKQSKAEILAGTPLNLNNYPQEGSEYVVTKLAPGIKVTGLPDGKNLAATKIKFNPDTKDVTYTDVMGNTVTEDFETFRQNIATINTGVDLSFIDRLKVTGRPGANTPKQQSSGMVSVTLKDGRKGNIPADQVDKFLKDNPGSKKQ